MSCLLEWRTRRSSILALCVTDLQEETEYLIFILFASALGEIDCSKRNVEVKGHLSEVSGLAVRDSRILLAVSKAKLQLEPCPVIFRDIKGRLCVVCREVQLTFISPVFIGIPYCETYHALGEHWSRLSVHIVFFCQLHIPYFWRLENIKSFDPLL